jgi:hypothetical protein
MKYYLLIFEILYYSLVMNFLLSVFIVYVQGIIIPVLYFVNMTNKLIQVIISFVLYITECMNFIVQ